MYNAPITNTVDAEVANIGNPEKTEKKTRKRMTPAEQIEYYKQQQAALSKKIKDAEQALREKERKNRTRDLIQIGGVVRKYVPDATIDSTAELIQIALAVRDGNNADLIAIGQAAKTIMPSITPHNIGNLLKMYISLFDNPDSARIDKSSLKAIYDQRKYIVSRLSTIADATDN